MTRIHPTAIIDPTARISDGAAIGAWCVVGPESVIGEGTELRSHVVVGPCTVIGRQNVIHPFAVVGGDPQDMKYRGEKTWLEIGDRNQIREHASIHRGTGNGGGRTRIGSENLVMAVAHVAHDCVIGNGVVLANNVMLAGHVHVEDFAGIGGAAGIHHFGRVGTCAFVGAMARCSKDVPPFMIVEGNPAEVRGHNFIAMKRRGYTDEDVDAMKEAYKQLFRDRGGSMLDKVATLRSRYGRCAPVQTLCDMVLEAGAGVNGRALEVHRADDKRASRVGTATASPFHPGGASGRP